MLLVTDADGEARGVADEIRHHLGDAGVHVFSDIEPEPSEEQIRAGVEVLESVRAGLIVAVGGGSVIDAAKAMRLFHESPELTLRELSLPFLDARKRVAQYPQIEHKVKLVAVPTTAGTGSEVSPAAVLTVGGPQGDARRLLTRARHGGGGAAPDALDAARDDGRHRHRRAHPRPRGVRVDLRLAVHRRLLPPGRYT